MENEQARQAGLRDRLWSGIRAAFPAAVMNGHPGAACQHVERHVSRAGRREPSHQPRYRGVGASSGSACMVGSIQPSHVLLAMGVEPGLAKSTVRFSLGKQTSEEEIETVISILPRIFARLAP